MLQHPAINETRRDFRHRAECELIMPHAAAALRPTTRRRCVDGVGRFSASAISISIREQRADDNASDEKRRLGCGFVGFVWPHRLACGRMPNHVQSKRRGAHRNIIIFNSHIHKLSVVFYSHAPRDTLEWEQSHADART